MPPMTASCSSAKVSSWRSRRCRRFFSAVAPAGAPRFLGRRDAIPPPIAVSSRAYPVEFAPANERAASVVVRGGVGLGLRRHEDRPAVRAAVHFPHPALLLRAAVPRTNRRAVAADLATRPRRARAYRRCGAPDARGATRCQPLCPVPRHVGGGHRADHFVAAAPHRDHRRALELGARRRHRLPGDLRLLSRGERAAYPHAPRRGDARGEHDVSAADLRRGAGARTVRPAAERADARRHRGDLHRRGDDGVDQTMEIAYFVLLNVLGHLCFVGSRMTTTLFALQLGASEFTVGVLVALFAVLPMFLSVTAGRVIDRLGPRRPVMIGLAMLACAATLPFFFPSVPGLRYTLIASGLLNMGWDIYGFLMPLYGSRIGLAAGTIGLVMSSFALATFVVRALLTMLVQRVRHWVLISSAMGVAGTAYLLFPFVHSVPLLMALSFMLGLGLGASQPVIMALLYEQSPRGRQGEAVGIRTTMMNGSQTFIPLASGAISAALGMAPVFALIAALLYGGAWFAKKRT